MTTLEIEQSYPNTYAPAIVAAIIKEQQQGRCTICGNISYALKQPSEILYEELFEYIYKRAVTADAHQLEELKLIFSTMPQEYADEMIIAYSQDSHYTY